MSASDMIRSYPLAQRRSTQCEILCRFTGIGNMRPQISAKENSLIGSWGRSGFLEQKTGGCALYRALSVVPLVPYICTCPYKPRVSERSLHYLFPYPLIVLHLPVLVLRPFTTCHIFDLWVFNVTTQSRSYHHRPIRHGGGSVVR